MHDTKVIAAHVYQGSESNRNCSCGWEWPEKRTYFCGEEVRIERAYVEHFQAELVRASTVTTEAELNALPDQTVIRSRFGVVYERWCDGLSDCWHKPASMSELPSHVPTLPATVLFRPV